MNRRDLQALTRVRLVEAKSLLDSGLYDGAYYLSGYAIECALKACIARQTRLHDFPPKPSVVRDIYTHDLPRLVREANLEADLASRLRTDQQFADCWQAVKDWSEDSRYMRWTADEARGLYTAIVDRRHGVLRWLRPYW